MFNKLLVSVVALAMLAITGCNTVQGAGKDIEKGGEKVQETAKDVKNKM